MSSPAPTARPTRRDPLPGQPEGVAWPSHSWPVAPPDATVDSGRLVALIDAAFGRDRDRALDETLALVVIHRGRLVAEAYGPETGADSTLISWSMAKSITHAMVGLLVDDGLLDIAAPAPVPQWANDHRSAITLGHLLAMTSGLAFVEDYVDDQVSDVIEMLFGTGADDVASFAASKPLIHEPGTHFSYSSGTTNIISAVCGQRLNPDPAGRRSSVEQYLRTRLFDPIGMTTAVPKFDAAGTFIGSSFVYASARDFARFGYLYLRDGVWDGSRILPAGWVEQARTPVDVPVDEVHWYGSHWWLWSDQTGALACQGYEGQRIVVVPARDLVVVRLGKTDADRAPDLLEWLTGIIDCFPER